MVVHSKLKIYYMFFKTKGENMGNKWYIKRDKKYLSIYGGWRRAPKGKSGGAIKLWFSEIKIFALKSSALKYIQEHKIKKAIPINRII